MNCKPGDLAIVIRGKHSGKLVEVLYLAPAHTFRLPDGVLNVGEPEGQSWVIKLLGEPVLTPMIDGPARFTRYGSGRDSYLRPLPGEKEEERHDEEITA